MSFFPSITQLVGEILLYGLLLLFLIAATIYVLTMLISALLGAPFVSSNTGKLIRILAKVVIDKNTRFYDLGCGDGAVVFFVAERYSCNAIGIERNPFLYWLCRLKQLLHKNQRSKFIRADMKSAHFSDATLIYLFLLPSLLSDVASRIRDECKAGTVIISHGFKIPAFTYLQFDKTVDKPFSTYYYRLD